MSTDNDWQLAMRLQEEEFASVSSNAPAGRSYQQDNSGAVARSHEFIRLADEYDSQLPGGAQPPWQQQSPSRGTVGTLLSGINRMRSRSNVHEQGNAAIQENVAADLNELTSTNRVIGVVFVAVGLLELISAAIVLAVSWDESCDRPLREWVILYSSRWLVLLPLSISKLITGSRSMAEERIKNWLDLYAVIVWSILQLFLFNSSNCSTDAPTLYSFAVALVAIQYVRILLPLILILLLICCLPVALILLRVLAPKRGADKSVIDKLPMRQAEASDLQEDCAVCLSTYTLEDNCGCSRVGMCFTNLRRSVASEQQNMLPLSSTNRSGTRNSREPAPKRYVNRLSGIVHNRKLDSIRSRSVRCTQPANGFLTEKDFDVVEHQNARWLDPRPPIKR